MATKVTFTAKNGSSTSGEIAWPAGEGAAPAVVLIQEWWGLNDHIRSLLDRLAAAGFVALAPDLYHGKVTKDSAEAMKMMTELDGHRAMDEIAGAALWLKANPRVSGKVGIIGFCLGGALSLRAAANVPEIDAAVPFYGVPDPANADYSKVRAPIQAHFAKRDEWATVAKAEEIKKQLDARGQPMELHVYDADHAFVNDTRPEVYAPEPANLAWDRATSFLKKHLAP
jgi:carboxymethylenebutenolidase